MVTVTKRKGGGERKLKEGKFIFIILLLHQKLEKGEITPGL
jgi:hypothetical protein